jgi:hypothetical protein
MVAMVLAGRMRMRAVRVWVRAVSWSAVGRYQAGTTKAQQRRATKAERNSQHGPVGWHAAHPWRGFDAGTFPDHLASPLVIAFLHPPSHSRPSVQVNASHSAGAG